MKNIKNWNWYKIFLYGIIVCLSIILYTTCKKVNPPVIISPKELEKKVKVYTDSFNKEKKALQDSIQLKDIEITRLISNYQNSKNQKNIVDKQLKAALTSLKNKRPEISTDTFYKEIENIIIRYDESVQLSLSLCDSSLIKLKESSLLKDSLIVKQSIMISRLQTDFKISNDQTKNLLKYTRKIKTKKNIELWAYRIGLGLGTYLLIKK